MGTGRTEKGLLVGCSGVAEHVNLLCVAPELAKKVRQETLSDHLVKWAPAPGSRPYCRSSQIEAWWVVFLNSPARRN